MAQDLGKIFRKSSEVPRAQESTKNIQEGLYEALDVNKKKPIRIDMCLGFSGEAIKKLDTERENLAKQGKSDDEILDLWLSEKLVVSPYSVAKTLFHLVVSILQRVEKYSQPFIIYSNRHGEKNVQGGLTKRGVEQTKQLGKNIAQKRDKKVDTLILTTHMSINEGLLSLLFPYAGFPPKWKGWLDFAETVKYSFFPASDDRSEAVLEVEWRGIKKQISCKTLLQKLKNPI